MDGSVFTRMVDMYKSIVVFMLTGGKTVLVPMFYENYFLATLRLLEKLHKVSTNDTRCSQLCLFGNTIQEGSVCVTVRWFLVICSLLCTVTFPGDQPGFCSMLPGKLEGTTCGVQPLLHPRHHQPCGHPGRLPQMVSE